MKRKLFLSAVFFFLFSLAFAQNKPIKDSTQILPNDIYSNFSKENYKRTKPSSFIITKNGDSVRVLSSNYNEIIVIADKFYKKKDFRTAAACYIKAFENNNGLGKVDDRLKAACCFSMLNNKDSAFLQLFRIVTKGHYTNLNEINAMDYLKPLHTDKRWQEVIGLINKNRAELMEKMNKEIQEKGLPNEVNQ